MKFPMFRGRRLRNLKYIRDSVSETYLSNNDFIVPVFIDENISERKEIDSMPGYYRLPYKRVEDFMETLVEQRLNKFLLFGITKEKDDTGSSAFKKDGVIQKTVKCLRDTFGKDIVIFTDVCMCQYTSHGHCGIISKQIVGGREYTYVDNDKSLLYLSKIAVSHAEAGVDFVAPSNMMDGVVRSIRESLDKLGFVDVGILSYSIKFSSNFYGPFREAAESSPKFGDRRSYQMDPRNKHEALKEAFTDIEEGADILMVKPALPYLDIISLIKESIPYYPLAAYNVSGEYLMVKSASMSGYLDELRVVLEILFSIKRAGADLIISYHAPDIVNVLNDVDIYF